MEADGFELLSVFESKVRVEIVKMLLELEFRSLSEISDELRHRGWSMTLSGVLKHMRELEKAGIVRHEPGIYAEKPDARKTIYSLEGRERIEKVLQLLEGEVVRALRAGVLFGETARVARQMQGARQGSFEKEHLESLLGECKSENVYGYLTDDERKKLELWKMMLTMM